MPTVPTLFDVRPVGPPLLLSFGCYISLSVSTLASLLERGPWRTVLWP